MAGVPHPKEVTCDASVALLTGIVRAFTNNSTIDEYVLPYEIGLPCCYIRIDVAHFLKLYTDFFKSETDKPKKVRIFYKAAMGQLILSRKEQDTRRILKAILILVHSETDRKILGSNGDTECERQKRFLINLINPQTLEKDEVEEEMRTIPKPENDISLFDETLNFKENDSNVWSILASELNEEAIEISHNEIGERDSAYFLPKLATKLLSNCRWILLWSNVYRDKYNYGRIPATSASVECEFKIVKKKFLTDK